MSTSVSKSQSEGEFSGSEAPSDGTSSDCTSPQDDGDDGAISSAPSGVDECKSDLDECQGESHPASARSSSSSSSSTTGDPGNKSIANLQLATESTEVVKLLESDDAHRARHADPTLQLTCPRCQFPRKLATLRKKCVWQDPHSGKS